MRRSRLLPTMHRLMIAILAATVCVGVTTTMTASEPKARQAQPDPASTGGSDDRWEERKARAREDVEYLEALLKAKQAACRLAEVKVTTATTYKAEIDRQKQKGVASTFDTKQREIGLAECQADFELRRVELKDVEIRLARTRRRLKAIERSGAAVDQDPTFLNEDRFRDLEIKYELLKSDFDQLHRSSKRQ